SRACDVPDLDDVDIINLVNLKFVSAYYGYRPEQVIALRSAGWSYLAIHSSVSGPRLVQTIDHQARELSRAHV
ncbi:MAG: hypothetical protein GY953_48050, partial [bacterium]|nr:hypothetical protein [bacterium]